MDLGKEWNRFILGLIQGNDSGFHLSVLANLKVIMTTDVEMASTDGLNLFINPDAWTQLSPSYREMVIVHRLWSAIGLHAFRKGDRDKDTYDMACFYALNYVLYTNGYKIPAGGIDNRFQNMSVEEIYEVLYNKPPQSNPPPPSPAMQMLGGSIVADPQQCQGSADGDGKGDDGDEGGSGESGKGDTPSDSSGDTDSNSGGGATNSPNYTDAFGNPVEPTVPTSAKDYEQLCKEMVQDSLTQAEVMYGSDGYGKMPAYLKSQVEKLFEPQINTRALLRRVLSERARTNYSYARPRTTQQSEIILPTLNGKRMGEVFSVFDVSGSVSDKQICVFNSETAFVQNVLKPKHHSIITFSTQITGIREMKRGERLDKLEYTGRGGTDLLPVFEHFKKLKRKPKAVMIYSDLYCPVVPIELRPPFPVFWFCFSNLNAKVEFGTLIHIDERDFGWQEK